MKRVVVTGADGFLGAHFVEKCSAEGIEVWAVIHTQFGNAKRISNYNNVYILTTNYEDLDEIVSSFPNKIDAFYHFAWIGVNSELKNDFDTQFKNIDLCMKVLNLAIQLKPRVFVIPGSTNEYMYYGKPIDENAVPSPQDAYGATKVALRFLAQSYAKKNNLGFIYTVITGIYAADRNDSNVISYTIEKLLDGEKPVLTKLEQMWDYVHIDDVVEALILIGEKGKDGAFYAIGKGDNQPLYKYIYMIRDLINPNLQLGIGEKPYLSSCLPSSCIELKSLKLDTGFEPKIQFENGIVDVINTIRDRNK